MVTFKLIQLYPGSKPLGYILKPVNNGLIKPDNYYQNGIWFNPSDYPKYWQEVKELTLLEEKVVEKDYEILSVSLQRSDKHKIHNVSEYKNTGYIKALLNCNGNKIHSIKRLSDSEIFTIGDKVFSEYANYTINKIKIVNNKCMITALYNTNNPNSLRLHYNLNNLKKCKQPLFTTEDGVDIFEGDKLYSICNMLNIKKHRLFNARYDDNTLLNNRIFFNSDYKHFSTKEKAEEYILMNKPLLSFNDIYDNLKVKDRESVLKFIKQKLNK